MMDSLSDGVLLVDDQARIVNINPVVQKITGLGKGRLLGQSIEVLMPQKERGEHEKLRQNYFDEPKRVEITSMKPYYYQHPLGVVRAMEVIVEPIIHPPEPNKAMVFIRGVTARVELETQLQQQNRLDLLGRLSQTVVYDFKSVLDKIAKQTALLKLRFFQNTHEHDRLQIIQRALVKAESLNKKLESLANQRNLKREVLEVAELIKAEEEVFTQLLTENIGWQLNLESSLPKIVSKKERLIQSISSLVCNAVDAMPKGGMLSLNIAPVELHQAAQEQTFLGPIVEGEYVMIEVTDTGEGIEKALQRKVVEPFVTFRDSFYHSGLGLTIVYQFVRESKGNMAVVSASRRVPEFSFIFLLLILNFPKDCLGSVEYS